MTAKPIPEATENGEPRQPLALWAIPAFLAIVIPALWWTWADSPFPFRLDLMLTMTLLVALVAATLFAALSGGFRHRFRWSLGVTAVLVTIAFQWPTLSSVGTQISTVTRLALLGDVVPVVLAGTLIWLATRLADDWFFAAGATAASVLAVLILGTTALSVRSSNPDPIAAETVSGPDVLVIVLDGYGRADWLQSEFDFDNSEFLRQLESRGFAIASDATANYAMTYAAVASMLNLDYVFDEGGFTSDEWDLMRSTLTGRAGLIPQFGAAGYETVYFENAWGGSQCGPSVDRCIRDGLFERSLWNVSQMTIFAPLMRQIRPDPFNSVSVDHLNALDDVVAEPSRNDQPRLTIAHTLVPHTPLLLNADCSRERYDELRRWGSDPEKLDARRHNYGEQATCVNQLVLEAVDRQLERDPNAIVMITADHGPASTLDVNLPAAALETETILERMKILGAYRLPGCHDSFRPDLTPVNGIRIATDCALGTDLGEVPDHNYWATISMTEPIVSVTPILSGEPSP